MRILVCLPTKNEKESIQSMIDRVKKMNLDLIVCDERSDDGTLEIASKNAVPAYQRDGTGKGAGVVKALKVAAEQGYDFMVLIDCDASYPPERIPDLLKFIPDYDMVVGARKMNDIQFFHRLVNLMHTGLINFLFGARLMDINSGLRVLNVRKTNNKFDADGFDIEAQITTRAIKHGFKIKEVPIDYKKRKGRSKIKAKDTFVIIERVIKERFGKHAKKR